MLDEGKVGGSNLTVVLFKLKGSWKVLFLIKSFFLCPLHNHCLDQSIDLLLVCQQSVGTSGTNCLFFGIDEGYLLQVTGPQWRNG